MQCIICQDWLANYDPQEAVENKYMGELTEKIFQFNDINFGLIWSDEKIKEETDQLMDVCWKYIQEMNNDEDIKHLIWIEDPIRVIVKNGIAIIEGENRLSYEAAMGTKNIVNRYFYELSCANRGINIRQISDVLIVVTMDVFIRHKEFMVVKLR